MTLGSWFCSFLFVLHNLLVLEKMDKQDSINPFHSDELSHTFLYNKFGIVGGPFCILRGCLSKFL